MQIIAGLTLKQLTPHVWYPKSPYFLPTLNALMISYADFEAMPAKRAAAMRDGIHDALNIPPETQLFLDNGAFTFSRRQQEPPVENYHEFVCAARPDWFPVPSDSIPAPSMTPDEQRACFNATMRMNRAHSGVNSDFVPVIHISSLLPEYLRTMRQSPRLRGVQRLALGGIVPNLLRTGKSRPYLEILAALRDVRRVFANSHLHIFGVGGTATVHLATLLGFDSADSSGWRNRAARGLVQLPGTGDRMVANLGNWKMRSASAAEWEILEVCPCPACQHHGAQELRASGTTGFAHRATHNLWVLLQEAQWVEEQLAAGTYAQNFRARLDNTTYLPLIEQALAMREVEAMRRERVQRNRLQG